MKLIVTDTNVFIDLLKCCICDEFFMLKLEIHTTQFVMEELHEEQRYQLSKYKEEGRLTVKEFAEDELVLLVDMKVKRRGVQRRLADKSVLFLCEKQRGLLLGGDGDLRKEAEERGLEVHGSIWLIGELVKSGILNRVEGIAKLLLLKEVNSRVPSQEIDRLIDELKIEYSDPPAG